MTGRLSAPFVLARSRGGHRRPLTGAARRVRHVAVITTSGLGVALAAVGLGSAPTVQAAAADWSPAAALAVTGTGPPGLYVATGPGTYRDLGGALIGAPAEVSASGLQYYVGTGTDRQLYVRTDALGWRLLSSALSGCTDNPAATLAGGDLVVDCRGTDGALWTARAPLPPGGSPPVLPQFTSLGGGLSAGPAVAVINGAVIHGVTGTDNRVYTRGDVSGWAGTGWACLGHPALAAAGSTAYFACRGTDNRAWFATNLGAGWSTHLAGGVLAGGPGIAASGNSARLFVQGTDNGVWDTLVGVDGSVGGFRADGGGVRGGVAATAIPVPAGAAAPQTSWTPVGALPLPDSEAAALTTHRTDSRPDNQVANNYVPTDAELAAYRSATDQYGRTPAQYNRLAAYVTGRSGLVNPSTDDLIQWAAHKWGIPEDWIRAQVVTESWWHQSALGDLTTEPAAWFPQFPAQSCYPNAAGAGPGQCYESLGVLQVRWHPDGSVGAGVEPLRWRSTQFNLDHYGATIRYYYDGLCDWCTAGYAAGQQWNSIGAWFSPYPWNNTGAQGYAGTVQNHLANRTWAQPGF